MQKIFKYKIIGILVFLFGVFVFVLFGYGIIQEYTSRTNDTYGYLILPIASLLFLLNLICLVLLIRRSSKTIIFLNALYILLLGLIVFGFVRKHIYLHAEFTDDDIEFTPISLIMLTFLIIMINKFKYRELHYENIELIGKKEE